MKINWAHHFDAIYCIHYLGNGKRLPGILRELDRVGISDSGIFQFVHTSRDPWERFVVQNCPRIVADEESNAGFVNLGLATARIYREALSLGLHRILVLEDDIRFLKSLDEIEMTLAALPDYPIVQLDKFLPWEITAEQYREIVAANRIDKDGLYYDGGSMFIASGACYALSQLGMNALLSGLKKFGPRPVDNIFNRCGMRRACVVKNIGVQVAFGDALLYKYINGENTHHKAYRAQGVRYADYNVPDGYDYGKHCAAYD